MKGNGKYSAFLKRSFFFSGMLFLLSSSFINAQPVIREPDSNKIRANHIRSITVYEYSYTDKRGNMLHRQYYKQFDRKGHVTQKFDFGPGRGPYRTEFKYDHSGSLAASLTYDPYEGGVFSTTYQYDASGNNVERAHYDLYGRLEYKNLYKFDEQGKPLEQGTYALSSKFSTKDEYNYDSTGNLLGAKLYYTDGKMACRIQYVYNEKGVPVEMMRYDGKDTNFTCKYLYKYDRKGNMVEEAMCNRFNEITERSEFEYDRKGDVIEQTFFYPKDRPEFKYKYKYRFFRK